MKNPNIILTFLDEGISRIKINDTSNYNALSSKNITSLIDIFISLNNDNILKLFKSKNYRGSRHLYDFPVRGQRTSTNAKTQKRLQRFKKFF